MNLNSLSRRQRQILKLAKDQGFVSIDAMAQDFAVTTQTIRRDINELCEAKFLNRFHGGASFSSSVLNLDYNQRKTINAEEKEGIAQLVAQEIPDNASLFINMGTTNESVAQALMRHSGLRVITNSLSVAHIMSSNPSFEVIVAGGVVRSLDRSIIGEATIDFFRQFRADYGVIAVGGIDEDGSLLDYNYGGVRVSQAIIENARHTLLVADSSKFGRNALVRLGHLSQIDTLVTDCLPKGPLAAVVKSLEIEVLTKPKLVQPKD
ncbi:DeoR family transcriptional regulator [Kiloniella laminariae]|uniref:DeoR family transcriptional regulator n=1 Tax=Kiloniella laminariae TaxID=454162 RepID=A0ABT4LK86_9PROT|nr:DeoR family transcriptional regulator [Kiloniella laminariae]MCZ4281523.1 DeoR family transcriptional regulator [Kiloniella laminariae]